MDLTLHLGAHRTGSTSVSDAFGQSVDAVKAMGTGFRRPNRLRKIPWFQQVESLTDSAQGGDRSAKSALATVAATLDKDMRQAARLGRRHLVYSEENILGFMEENLGKGVFYPNLTKRLDAYTRIFPLRPTRIGLGLRAYDAMWVSAYHYTLAQRPWPPFETLADRFIANRRGWVEIVGEIRAFFPDAEIFLWRQEDLHQTFRQVVARLGQLSDPARLTLPDTPVNTSLSAAEAALVHLLRRQEPGLRGAALAAQLATYQGERPPAAPTFAEAERAALRARYAADLALLRGSGFDIIDPADGAG